LSDQYNSVVEQHLDELERYYDAVPRLSGRAEDFGPLTLFVRANGGFPFYARPTMGSQEPVTMEHIQAVRGRQRELGVPESFEWVAETSPELRTALEESGLRITECPLLVLSTDAPTTQLRTSIQAVRILDADSPALPSAVATQRLAFAEEGTAKGTAGVPQLIEEIEKATADGAIERARARVRSQATVYAAVLDGDTALCAGQHNPVGRVTEIVAVGTLPAHRRVGLGVAVTAALVADARSRGAQTAFLSAADEHVARIYRRLGFQRVGTAMIVE
jgi:ribosomal protein S18 acetylase RimI-like enzyme